MISYCRKKPAVALNAWPRSLRISTETARCSPLSKPKLSIVWPRLGVSLNGTTMKSTERSPSRSNVLSWYDTVKSSDFRQRQSRMLWIVTLLPSKSATASFASSGAQSRSFVGASGFKRSWFSFSVGNIASSGIAGVVGGGDSGMLPQPANRTTPIIRLQETVVRCATAWNKQCRVNRVCPALLVPSSGTRRDGDGDPDLGCLVRKIRSGGIMGNSTLGRLARLERSVKRTGRITGKPRFLQEESLYPTFHTVILSAAKNL